MTTTQRALARLSACLRVVKSIVLLLALLLGGAGLTQHSLAANDPMQGPGGPVLVLTSASGAGGNGMGAYYAEILRTQGLNAFDVADIASLSPALLAPHPLVLLAPMALDAGQAGLLGDWVAAGGRLIAMAPDDQLAGLLGLTPLGTTLSDAYLRVDIGSAPGNGIVDRPIQFHGTAQRLALNGATAIATLYDRPGLPTAHPALTLRNVGAGQAAAFTFDLARSVVTTRQGNPAWAAQERDGLPPIRADDKFFGAAGGDPQADWIDPTLLAVPQADELLHLLSNLIGVMSAPRLPLPRFWYFPRGSKAVVVMTGDDHGNGGTAARFDQFKALGPAGCSVADWACVRATSYLYASTPLSDAQVAQYTADGFELGLHIDTGCQDYDAASLQGAYDTQMAAFQLRFPGAGALLTQRHHCVVWSDWSSGAEVQARHGMRLDTSYYFWPPGWVGNVPGLFTGSALPMRYARLDGTPIDVVQAATQMSDESGQSYPYTIDTLLDRALGPEGVYGAYTVNAHTDLAASPVADAVVASARARGVPVISARQLLEWLDARNASVFAGLTFDAGVLSFTVDAPAAARGLTAMLPLRAGGRQLTAIARSGSPVAFSLQTVKGVDYAFFSAPAGPYAASYGQDSSAPVVLSVSPAAGATGVDVATRVTARFGESMDATSLNAASFELRGSAGGALAASVVFDAASRTATLTPAVALAPASSYSVLLHGGSVDPRVKDAAGNALAADQAWSFSTAAAPGSGASAQGGCPCSAFAADSAPARPAVNDPNPVELGVKFRTDVDGVVTGVRFYKGSGNTGSHRASLWTSAGQLLGSAIFSNETASGWQQVDFPTPVAVSAGAVYVASYFAPAGRYAGDNNFFAAHGVDNGAVHLLRDGVSGGNGVYRYASAGGFPTDSFMASNYWVDVVFRPGAGAPPPSPPVGSADACAAPANAVVAENCRPGNPPAEWDVAGIGDPSIQGYASDISVNRGNSVSFKLATSATSYRLDIYRLGYYAGLGARKVATVQPSVALPQVQPACLNDAVTGLIDCGNWSVSASWAVPADAVSGVYLARAVRTDTGGASHIVFIVRDDAGSADLLFQTSDSTWQAYNNYGGNSLYTGSPAGRAYQVSYNRPFQTRGVDGGQDWLFNSEYPMLRWLEANGYDLSYAAGVDAERLGAAMLRRHRVFLSVGHDEYWSGGQRASVEAAREAGVHLAFFSGNEMFWKTRWTTSIDASATPWRTLVSYKETHANARLDPSGVWTGTWRDPRFSPPADGGRPENALSGTLFMVNDGATTALQVPEAEGKLRLWRNTTVATQSPGGVATLAASTLGYEWDVDADNGQRPPGLMRLSSTTVTNAPVLQDFGSTYAPGSATHALTVYRHASGARVFSAGTVQWSWGLDATHDRAGPPADARMQQATINLLADMGVQPGSPRPGMASATASLDAVAPQSTITAPAALTQLTAGSTAAVSGTALDAGGGVVAGVEVSTDAGTSWHPATGRANWTYRWSVGATGSATLRSRAVDDSGNLEQPGPGVTVNVLVVGATPTCPCSIWPAGAVPGVASHADTNPVNLGLRWRSDVDGYVTGVRFYKGAGNLGTHVGSLWTDSGSLLASASFAGETASGWQQLDFATPVAVSAGTVYVVSYFAPRGGYAGDNDFFALNGVENPPLHALGGPANGMYRYAALNSFPAASFRSTNYWVDLVFVSQLPAGSP
ncbi:MAG: hypothetical protein RIQ60_1029 [Pseudomonadota bacterium]|jgi:hypothetical protein